MEIKTWDGIPEEKIGENISRQMFWGENIMVTRWQLASGTDVPVHEHAPEQITIVQRGQVTLIFPGKEDVLLREGGMIVIPPSAPHGAKVGPEGCTVLDLFSPLRWDLIEQASAHLAGTGEPKERAGESVLPEMSDEAKYLQLQGYLSASGIEVPLDQLQQVPLDLLARYVYERECVTMGQLRAVLGIDKKQAKELLRQWKHGDDHSESSLKRSLERIVIIPWEHTREK